MPSTNTSPLMPGIHFPKGKWFGDFPFGGFWKQWDYYESAKSLHFTHSLDEWFGAPLYLPPVSYWQCESVEQRPLCLDSDEDLTGTYVILCTLHPVDQRILRFGFWPTSNTDLSQQFSRVENDMVVIALAATGLAL